MDLTQHINVLRLLITHGLVETLRILASALAISLGVGIILGSLRSLRIPVIDQLLASYALIIRGTPFLVLILVVFYVLPIDQAYFAALVALVLSHGAYLMEIIKGGIFSVHRGQLEAARALSMSTLQALRFVVLPQVLLVVSPAVVGQLVVLIKDTALTSVIGVVEITRMGRSMMQVYGHPIVIFGYVLIIYFILSHIVSTAGSYLEARISSKIIGPRKLDS